MSSFQTQKQAPNPFSFCHLQSFCRSGSFIICGYCKQALEKRRILPYLFIYKDLVFPRHYKYGDTVSSHQTRIFDCTNLHRTGAETTLAILPYLGIYRVSVVPLRFKYGDTMSICQPRMSDCTNPHRKNAKATRVIISFWGCMCGIARTNDPNQIFSHNFQFCNLLLHFVRQSRPEKGGRRQRRKPYDISWYFLF